jgi:hypothetical protein
MRPALFETGLSEIVLVQLDPGDGDRGCRKTLLSEAQVVRVHLRAENGRRSKGAPTGQVEET